MVALKRQSHLSNSITFQYAIDVEMPSVISLAKMELNGLGFSVEECEKQRKIIIARYLRIIYLCKYTETATDVILDLKSLRAKHINLQEDRFLLHQWKILVR